MKHENQFVDCACIAELKPVLYKWCDLNREFFDKLRDDCPWWYNERASMSVFAAAAWKTKGFISLEEFSTTKGRIKTKSERSGRCDLKLWHDSKRGFAFEGKQTWCRLDKGIDLGSKSNDIMAIFRQGQDDARELKTHMGRRFGMCFVSPRIHVNERDSLDRRLDQLLYLLTKKHHDHAIAWYFAEDPGLLLDKATRLLYPGVVLLLKEVKK